MDKINQGWLNGLIGVIIFAGSMPATRIAVTGFNPEFLTGIRAVIAGVLGLICLIALHQTKPNKPQTHSLIIVAVGVVIGFPLFTALALQTISSARALVFVGLLPLSTAIFSVLRTGERPNLKFWFFAILGSSFVIGFMLLHGQDQILAIGDLYMLASIILCGLGYAEGGKLSRELGGWQVICWALVIALPFMILFSLYSLPENFDQVTSSSFMGLLYVSTFSMLIGFFFWYKGLALGGIAKVGQIQLVQPFIGLILSAFLLGEHVSLSMILVSCAVVLCVALAKKFA
ncbi:DMT family transporter [Acinetobacter sp. ANC 3832]|uniref:DMT family transporter n=1 Tax=Acinetobacter sp. ANC 3832 TaxID=1977874 RepID=UPI000A34AA17|nr:DMT family transporter [Acinetobacter sp. ANC 3832]OTG92350.1 EamA family transporter [Acinetobacter sp. ANC 3832]